MVRNGRSLAALGMTIQWDDETSDQFDETSAIVAATTGSQERNRVVTAPTRPYIQKASGMPTIVTSAT